MTALLKNGTAASDRWFATAAAPEYQRMMADRQELAERIAALLPRDGAVEPQPGLFCYRRNRPTQPLHSFYDPSFCVIAQGSKLLLWGNQRLRYDPAHYLITTVDLPMIGQIVEASPTQPYLGLRLLLPPAMVASVMMDTGFEQDVESGGVKGADVSRLDADMMNAVLRVLRLAEKPVDFSALSPLVVREIIYRLLTGAQARRMVHLARIGGQAQRIVRAVKILRDGYAKPLRMEHIARSVNMSISGFHAHFKAVTAMSPLQFQKHLRLQEARRLMMDENLDAGEAGYRVGYEDASQFNREYKRQFGRPPMRDVERMHELAAIM